MFKFETKEQREAWRVISDLILSKDFPVTDDTRTMETLINAADRFDKREETCGIEPLSEGHASLIFYSKGWAVVSSGYAILNQHGLLSECKTKLSDKGREVLANLNAMCKVQK